MRFLAFLIILTGCSELKEEPHSKREENGVFSIPLFQDIRGLDPLDAGDILTSNVARHIYDGLVDYSPLNLKLEPELAHRYEVSEDGLHYTFHLRDGVYFHDDPCFEGGIGRELNAEDVRFSISRVIEQNKGESPPSLRNYLKEMEVKDSLTIVFHLKKPLPDFLHTLATNLGWIVPKEAIDYYGDNFTYHPVGTGPFRVVLFDPPERIVMVKNEKYFKRDEKGENLPYLGVLIFRFMASPKIEANFRRGDVDLCFVTLPVLPEKTTQFHTYETNKWNTLGVAFNMEKNSPFTRNRKVRRAIFLALPSEFKQDIPANSFLPPGMPFYSPIIRNRRQNFDEAKKLLKEAGYPEGKGLPPLDFYIPVGDEVTYGIPIKEALSEIGINVRIHIVPRNVYWQEVEKGSYPFFRAGWIADNPDSRLFYSAFYSNSILNLTRFKNRIYDSLYLASFKTNDPDTIGYILLEMEKILLKELPFLYMKHEILRVTVRGNIKGFSYSANPLNRWYFERVFKE
jgi:peptide/nickel transport system substrate-binding protein